MNVHQITADGKRKPRLLQTRTGVRVLNSNRCDPIVLPPFVPITFTAEELWTSRIEIQRELYEARAAEVVCPPGARLIPLGGYFNPKAAPFAVIDEEDFERVSKHQWRARVRNGQTCAVAAIEGAMPCEMSRFVMGIGHRYIRVHHLGESFDNRKSRLIVDRSRVERTPLAG